jgi:hypothetical protein
MRRALLVGFVLLLGTAVLPASATGVPPTREHYRLVGVHEDLVYCGLTVDETFKGVFTNHAFFDSDGNFVRFQGTAAGSSTFTAANGKSVIVTFAQRMTNPELIIDEAAGTSTFVFTITGLSDQLRAAAGGVLTLDAGLLTFAITFDLETGAFISNQVIALHGPHPEIDTGFTALCEAFVAALA